MNQTRLGSLIEAIVNILIGFGINFIANLIVLPRFGFAVTPSQAFGIGLVFTVISIARSYVIRRWFNARLHAAALRMSGKVGAGETAGGRP
jgi:hypothetical protein